MGALAGGRGEAGALGARCPELVPEQVRPLVMLRRAVSQWEMPWCCSKVITSSSYLREPVVNKLICIKEEKYFAFAMPAAAS